MTKFTSKNAQVNYMVTNGRDDFTLSGAVRIFSGRLPKWASDKLMQYARQQDTDGARFEEWSWLENGAVYTLTISGPAKRTIFNLMAQAHTPKAAPVVTYNNGW